MNSSLIKYKLRLDRRILAFGLITEVLYLYGKTNSTIFLFIGSLFLLSSLVFMKKQDILLLLIFLLPNQRLLTFVDNGTSVLNGLLLFLFVLIINDKPKIKKLVLPSFIILSYGVFLVFVNDSLFELAMILKLLITCIVCFVLFTQSSSDYLYAAIFYFILGSLAVGILSFLYGSLEIGGYTRFEGGIGNEPNYAGTLFSLSLSLFLYIEKRLYINLLLKWLIPAVLIFFGILTMSRAFILSATVIVTVYLLYKLRDSLVQMLLFAFVASWVFLERIIIFYNNSALLQILTERIINPRNDDVSGGRLGFWTDYWFLITSTYWNLFFGLGSSAMSKADLEQVAHNFFLEDMLTFGLIGVLLLYSFLLYFFNYFKREQVRIYILLPLTIFLLNGLTLHSFLGMGGLAMYFICLLPFYINKKEII